jgi:hypothetical protein
MTILSTAKIKKMIKVALAQLALDGCTFLPNAHIMRTKTFSTGILVINKVMSQSVTDIGS